MSDVGSRRVIAARFRERVAADAAARALASSVARPQQAQISVAPLGAPGQATNEGSYVLVARVAVNEYASAERLISDRGGDVILAQRETVVEPEGVEAGDEAISASSPNVAHGMSPAN
jgi:hypothetical protein